jgi:selenocysteine-specific elongation factor
VEIQPIVIGTAGHIDHGKSSLVRALTGIDPDRLKEEKERGLTIDLGFAPLQLPDGRTVGIIDVPGHERFIRNMVAGATGIDLVMLVVAADDGVMPQTREHLQIMGLLGVRSGFIVLNKVDMVERGMAELAAEEVRETVAGTFLADAPIVPVSAVTGEGLDELRRVLFALAERTAPRSAEGVFRMPIQRVFSARGFGTVLTGIPISGEVRVGDLVEVLPGGQRGKVRGIQAYGQSSPKARAGHSSALNIADVDHHLVARGNAVATPNFFTPVRMVGARLTVLAGLERPLADRTPIRLHTGTADPLGEVVLLDSPALSPGETGLVQLRLEEAIVCAPGDPFVLRLASPSLTLGGGVILEESRYRLKRFKGFVLEELHRAEQSLGSPAAFLESVLSRGGLELVALEDLAHAIKRSEEETAGLLAQLQREARAVALGGAAGSSQARWIHPDRLEEALRQLRAALEDWFQRNPHRQVVEAIEIKRLTKLPAPLVGALLEQERARGAVALEPGGMVRRRGRTIELDPQTAQRRASVLAAIETAAFQPPTPEELASSLALPGAEIRRLLELLVDEGALKQVNPELYLTSGAIERARAEVARNCEQHGHLEIPALRDALATSRKFLIPLLEHFDAQGLTIRQGANRVLKKR